MDIEQVIVELQRILNEKGNKPVYVSKTDNGVTFYPEEVYIYDFEVEEDKLYIG